jgi:hypothetical protein
MSTGYSNIPLAAAGAVGLVELNRMSLPPSYYRLGNRLGRRLGQRLGQRFGQRFGHRSS